MEARNFHQVLIKYMITLILIVLIGIINALMDIIMGRYNQSIFSLFNPDWWNPQLSWKHKWVYPLESTIKAWYYFGFYPRYKERFIYSSTIFVGLTDAWHFFKIFFIFFIVLGIVCYTPIINPYIDWLVYYITWTSVFTIFYDYIFNKK